LFEKTVESKNEAKSDLMNVLNGASTILLAGYSRDTAILEFVKSYAEMVGPAAIKGEDGKRMILLSDCSTPDCNSSGGDDLELFRQLGVHITTSDELAHHID
jgi:hypothetical protein